MALAAARLQALNKGTGQSRKVFRLGKTLNEYQKAMEALESTSLDPTTRSVTLVGKAAMGAYWALDNASWLSSYKVIDADKESLSLHANRGWAVGTLASLVLAVWALQGALRAEKEARVAAKAAAERARSSALPAADATGAEEAAAKAAKAEAKAGAARRAATLTVIKSGCDWLVAANSANWFQRALGRKLHDGQVGVVGAIAAAIVIWNEWCKLK